MKRLSTLSLILAFLLLNLTPGGSSGIVLASPAMAVLPITARSAILIDLGTQRIIYAKAPHVKHSPASTTKVMTALVVLERMSPEAVVRIPRWVSSIEPSKADLRPGEHYRVRDLVHAALISSANDAAEVLSVAAAGSRGQFAQWMNRKARRIGCRDTHFTNASGLPSGSPYSSSYDLVLIMREARKNSFIVDSLGRKYHSIQSLEGRKIFLKNHNKLLWRSHQTVIGKTGYTLKGRHCFVGRIQWGGREVLVSLLGSHTLWRDLKVLLDYQFGAAFYRIYKNRRLYSRKKTRKIQTALQRAGFSPGSPDGQFGFRTLHAVELFQKANGLSPDGIVHTSTCRKLTRFGLSKSYCA